ncbi:MAG: hypothetical protein KHW93_03375 [Butyricicoccus pullicaecorum]|nr:hypothetical protein [Butyricicoccus pullicaecorum]
MYDYSAAQWLLIFYIYCFCGWVFESAVVSVQQKRPVNRGFLRGPMLPIYGFGATIMLHVSLPLAGHPVQIYFAGMVVATAFEYVVGVVMEAIFKVKYWDYSEHRFQFQGRICLQSSLAWGMLSVLLVYVLHPPVEYLLEQFNLLPLVFTASVLSVYFLTDVAASVKTALDFAKLLEELDTMRANVDAMREQFAAAAWQKRAELTAAAQEAREQLADAAQEGRDRLTASAENARLQMYLAIQDAEDQITDRIKNMKLSRKWMVRGNPGLRSARFDKTLREIKDRLNR